VSLTLGESMALAVLRGDRVAAYALADQLIEEYNGGFEKQAQAARALREGPQAYDGYDVYSWPEFQAFAKRLGVLWDLRTISIRILLDANERVEVEQVYAGSDAAMVPRGAEGKG
jgi:hypothetical protein